VVLKMNMSGLFQGQHVGVPHAYGRKPFAIAFAAEQFGVFAALDEDAAVAAGGSGGWFSENFIGL
jgi:hypothetical protein